MSSEDEDVKAMVKNMEESFQERMDKIRRDGVAEGVKNPKTRQLLNGEEPKYRCFKIWNGGNSTNLWEVFKKDITEDQAKLKFLVSILENPGYTVELYDNEVWEYLMSYVLEWSDSDSLDYYYLQENRDIYDLGEIVPKRWWEAWKGGLDMPPNVVEGERDD